MYRPQKCGFYYLYKNILKNTIHNDVIMLLYRCRKKDIKS